MLTKVSPKDLAKAVTRTFDGCHDGCGGSNGEMKNTSISNDARKVDSCMKD